MKRRIVSILLSLAMIVAFSTNAFAHGVFFYVSDMHSEIGQEVTVQVGWGYVFMGHDGSAITGNAPIRRMFLISPNGTETPLTYRVFHQYYGRDYPDNPINEVTLEQLGTDDFPTGGRNITYIEIAFTPQVEGYYQVFFHRDRNVPETGGNEGRFIVDLVKTYVLVGTAAPTSEAGHGVMSGINRTEIRPISDVGRLTPGSVFEGYVLFDGQPVAEQEVRFEIAAHEYIISETNVQGRFSIALPSEVGEYAIRVVQDWEESGTAHGQDFTSRRDIHILQIAITNAPPVLPDGAVPAEAVDVADTADTADVEETPAPVALNPPAPAPGDLPPLFNLAHYISFVVGGVLLLAAGFLFGLGMARRGR